ncbi:tetratricopeptide repeat protein [Rhizobium leucaenae]|uniref:Tetratricopeptide (TPR) repeat protein n=1 Tax=Rhizobium leucaenae TaxID=29450 RepID=A0A7W6ZYX0_9HYPH|nr:tetratricopeptide repeat protein [Rhizobium leucaenae]MBB4570792.1 tetratricopeptide (TPR) repeat protein [Rhizobium leucaenae]MBB6303666.1 tetratricopeptide (TPR) repeat protein [Rhizobium leucaenae]
MKESQRLAIIADAVAAFNQSNRDVAKQLCEAGLDQFPSDPSLSHLLAAILFAEEDFSGAREKIESSLAAQPRNVPALILAGKIYRAEHKLEAALRQLEKATGIDGRLEIFVEKARILDQMGNKSAARDAWSVVLDAKPTSLEAINRLSSLARERGALVEAEQLLERAVALDDHPGIWFELALVRHDLQKLDGAAQAYRRVLEINADAPEAAVNLGVVLQEAGRMDEAMAAFSTAYALDESTFGVIAMALTSAPCGRLWLDETVLRQSLVSGAAALGAKSLSVDARR